MLLFVTRGSLQNEFDTQYACCSQHALPNQQLARPWFVLPELQKMFIKFHTFSTCCLPVKGPMWNLALGGCHHCEYPT